MLDELETEEKNEKYKEYFKKAFNISPAQYRSKFKHKI